MLDPVDGPLGKLLKPIAKALGMETHNETFSDIQISNLLTVGSADKSARRTAQRAANGSIGMYNESYQGFRRDYRKKYSSRFLKSLGYAPTSSATTRVLYPAKVFDYVATDIDSTITEIDNTSVKYLLEEDVVFNYLQTAYGTNWDNSTRRLSNSAKWYGSPIVTNDCTDLHVRLTRDYEETIIDNLAINYQYDTVANTVVLPTGPATAMLSGTSGVDVKHIRIEVGTTEMIEFDTVAETVWEVETGVLVNGTYLVEVYETISDGTESKVASYSVEIDNEEVYDVGAISSSTVGDPLEYSTEVTLQTDPSVVVTLTTLAEYFNDSVSNAALDEEHLYVYYESSDGRYYSYIEPITTLPAGLYPSKTVELTAIIPLKEDNQIKDLEDYKLKRMLSKLHLSPDDLVESLQNKDLDSAYIMTGVHPGATGPAAAKALYNTFDTATEGSGTVTISMARLSMTYRFTMDKTIMQGQVQPVGMYSKELTGTTMTMIYQGSAAEYKQIVISGYTQEYTISGERLQTGLDGSAEYSRILLPIDVLNGLRYREFTEVYERSLCMLGFSTETVEIKWYETGAFGVVLKIVAIVITIISWGAASGFAALLWAMATTVAIAVIVGIVVRWGIRQGNALGYAVALIATVLGAMAGTGNNGFASATAWLKLAGGILNTMNQAIQFKTNELLMKGEEELKEIGEKYDDVTDKLKEIEDEYEIVTSMNFNMLQACEASGELMDSNTYVELMLGKFAMNYEQLYDIDYEIDRRKNVLVAV